MPRLRTVVTILLLALWVPATLHCAFEAAGFLPDQRKYVSSDGRAEVGCSQVEGGLVKQSSVTLRVMPPTLVLWNCPLCIQRLAPPSVAAVSEFSPSGFEQPQDWITLWAFEHRAALPPRAPTVSLA